MIEIVEREIVTCDLREAVNKFIPESISKEIEKAAAGIYPLQDVFVRKVKIMKKPKFDVSRLLEIHGDASGAVKADGTPIAPGQRTAFVWLANSSS
jgi:small subunit ribosomal protein S3Ae